MAVNYDEIIKNLRDTTKTPDLKAIKLPTGTVANSFNVTEDESREFDKELEVGWTLTETELKQIWSQAKFVGFNIKEKKDALNRVRLDMGKENFAHMINFLCQLIVSQHLKFKTLEKQVAKRGNRELYVLFREVLARYSLTLNHVALICAGTVGMLHSTVKVWGAKDIDLRFQTHTLFSVAGGWQFAMTKREKGAALAGSIYASAFSNGYKKINAWDFLNQLAFWKIQTQVRVITDDTIDKVRKANSYDVIKEETVFETDMIMEAFAFLAVGKTRPITEEFFLSICQCAAAYMLSDRDKKIVHKLVNEGVEGGGAGFAKIGYDTRTVSNPEMAEVVNKAKVSVKLNTVMQLAFYGNLLPDDVKKDIWPDYEKLDIPHMLSWGTTLPDFLTKKKSGGL